MRFFAYALSRKLKRTFRELMCTMDAEEFMEQLAYDMLQDQDFKQKIEDSVALEKSAKKTAEQRAEDIRKMFAAIGG